MHHAGAPGTASTPPPPTTTTTATTPAFPPPVEPARHTRLAESLSPPRAASQRRWSHSKGRPSTLQGAGTERSMSRGTADSSSGAGWRERSESRDGSRAPLWRSNGAGEKPTKEEAPRMETSAAEDDGKVTLEGGGAPRAKGIWLVRLARHFVGIRDRRSFPTPLVRPLRHLSPTTEGYVLGFLGSFPSILIACGISLGLSTIPSSAFSATPLTVGSLGATAVLLYAIPEGPLSQPRNLVGGHLLCAVTGAVISQLFSLSSRFDIDEAIDNEVAMQGSWQHLNPVAAALAVGIAVFGMQITGTVHPPGGATALIASYIRTTSQRWTYVLDVFLSVSAMGVWAMVVGNIGRRRYPAYWWTPNPPPAPDPEPSIPVPISPKKQPSERRPSSGARSVESPAEDLDRRWLGRLGEVDEEALAEGDELARREEERWLARERKLEEDEAERGRRATRR